MEPQTHIAAQAIRYIEDHLNGKLDLEAVAAALHYSKFYLHRCFTKTVGLTVHEYIQRRQLTQAAKRLVFSQKPILEIALQSGYESQQAFSTRFKELYKTTPAGFRAAEVFYPLQLVLPRLGTWRIGWSWCASRWTAIPAWTGRNTWRTYGGILRRKGPCSCGTAAC